MEPPKDDLKWFGDGFDGFPKRLREDCVEYMLFIIDSSLTQKDLLNQLEGVRKEALKLTKKLLKDYIWQRDEFTLKPEVQSSSGLKYLHGLTNYGDSVDDEWLIVYILRELSRQFQNLWIKVVDTDGEFLLIEAANTLPKWLRPEIADNRVWINDDKLRIISPAEAPSSSEYTMIASASRPLTLSEAYKIISIMPHALIHSPLMEAEAFYRLRNYPSQISNSLHHARITVPRKLAYIIHNCPSSIAPAIEAFYLRDPIAMKQLAKDSSDQVVPPVDLVSTSIKFTKVLFAQLKSQKFSAPNAWKACITEAERAAIYDHAKQADFTRLELGMKVTSGFEMLMSDPAYQDNRSVQEVKILIGDLMDGAALPTDAEMTTWCDVEREDDESWLDINFEDFENELQGKQTYRTRDTEPEGAFGPKPQSGFGDARTQADLKKMVQRLEEFLNDEEAGIDGADVDIESDDDDDDDDDDDSDDSQDEDTAVSFDEKKFVRMMREMTRMPSEEDDENQPLSATNQEGLAPTVEKPDSDAEEGNNIGEAEEIRKIMHRIEAELNEAGVLDLDPAPSQLAALKSGASKDGPIEKSFMERQEWEDENDEDVNIDFNLAKNLLESFKSQAGTAGPASNLMSMMGMQMPRDDDSSHSPKLEL